MINTILKLICKMWYHIARFALRRYGVTPYHVGCVFDKYYRLWEG